MFKGIQKSTLVQFCGVPNPYESQSTAFASHFCLLKWILPLLSAVLITLHPIYNTQYISSQCFKCLIFRLKKKKKCTVPFLQSSHLCFFINCSSVEPMKPTWRLLYCNAVMWCEGTVSYYHCDISTIFTFHFLKITHEMTDVI